MDTDRLTTLEHRSIMHIATHICHFFKLPRENRDLVYTVYVTIPGGYAYDAERNKLVQADGDKIDLQLARACRMINREMRGLALQNNKIVFKTFTTPSSSANAGVLHATVHRIERSMWHKLCVIGPAFLMEHVRATITAEFPQFDAVVSGLVRLQDYEDIEAQTTFSEPDANPWGGSPSIYRDSLERLFDLVSAHPDWTCRSEECRSGFNMVPDPEEAIPKPWSKLQTED
ncbi:hypothetical protein E8E11_001799 [Didymella keratinophila]|nr:hypothetical protein E8E11_001799 [Didymella keratinophila]